MLVQCQFLVVLMSLAIIVDSNPHGNHPCPQAPGPGATQDVIFDNCDYGVGGEESENGDIAISQRIGAGASESEPDKSSDGSIPAPELGEGSNSDKSSDGNIPGSELGEGYNPDNSSDESTTKLGPLGDGSRSTTAATVDDNEPTQTPSTVTNTTVSGRQPGCAARPDPGECRGAFPRYYYNVENDQCDCFLYGGCDEEGIVFTWLTLDECHQACVPGNTTAGSGCQRVTLEEVQRFLDPPKTPVNNHSPQVDEDVELQDNEIVDNASRNIIIS